jgi:hypothetical protein
MSGRTAEANIRIMIRAYQEKVHSETRMQVDKSNKVYVSHGKNNPKDTVNGLFKPGKHY